MNIAPLCAPKSLKSVRLYVNFKPFGPIPALLAIAAFVTKVHAICQKCGSLANYSFRKAAIDAQVLLGEKDTYEPRCRTCFYEDFKG